MIKGLKTSRSGSIVRSTTGTANDQLTSIWEHNWKMKKIDEDCECNGLEDPFFSETISSLTPKFVLAIVQTIGPHKLSMQHPEFIRPSDLDLESV